MVSRALKWGIPAALVCFVLWSDTAAFAQMGMGGMGGGSMGGMGGGSMGGGSMGRPKRKLHKNKAPALSPALNMLPETNTTFEGQFLMRQLPQEAALQSFRQTEKSLDKLQTEITDTDNRVKSGIKGSGHRTRFMSYGGYFAFPGAAGGGKR